MNIWDTPNKTLNYLQGIPDLQDAYDGLGPITCVESLRAVPPLTEAGYLLAMPSLGTPCVAHGGAYVFVSSGTTGIPKLGFQPAHQDVPEILAEWLPALGSAGDVFADFTAGGKGGSSNHFFREVCRRSDMVYLHLGGAANEQDLSTAWGKVLLDSRASVISGTPTQLGIIADYLVRQRHDMPSVRSVLWTGEPLKPFHRKVLACAFPEASLWSVYGGTETWVIGFQTPAMGSGEFQVFEHQFMEVIDETPYVTGLSPSLLNPILRYALSDRVEALDVDSDGRVRRLRVKGRSDNALFMHGNNIYPSRIVAAVREIEGVDDAQLVLHERDGATEEFVVRLRPSAGTAPIGIERIIAALVTDDLQNDVLRGALSIDTETPFYVNGRSGKCPDHVIIKS